MPVLTPLMAEHAVILRMMEVVRKIMEGMPESNREVHRRLDNVIEFLCMYVDRCHHAKEEDIFFSHCEKKGIPETDRNVMTELIEEHIFIMKTVGELIDARREHGNSFRSAEEIGRNKLALLTSLFPEHMRKENEIFFPKALKYFSPYEQYSILREFWRFNERMPMEKYHALLQQLEVYAGRASHSSMRLSHSL